MPGNGQGFGFFGPAPTEALAGAKGGGPRASTRASTDGGLGLSDGDSDAAAAAPAPLVSKE